MPRARLVWGKLSNFLQGKLWVFNYLLHFILNNLYSENKTYLKVLRAPILLKRHSISSFLQLVYQLESFYLYQENGISLFFCALYRIEHVFRTDLSSWFNCMIVIITSLHQTLIQLYSVYNRRIGHLSGIALVLQVSNTASCQSLSNTNLSLPDSQDCSFASPCWE